MHVEGLGDVFEEPEERRGGDDGRGGVDDGGELVHGDGAQLAVKEGEVQQRVGELQHHVGCPGPSVPQVQRPRQVAVDSIPQQLATTVNSYDDDDDDDDDNNLTITDDLWGPMS